MDIPNLYESGGYFVWRHPKTGKRYGIGRDREDAIAQAEEANAALDPPARLIDRVTAPSRLLKDFLPIYRKALETRELRAITKYQRRRQLTAIEEGLGDVVIGARQEEAAEVTRRFALFLAPYGDEGKRRMAKSLRSTLIDLCAEMAAGGWLSVNPAKVIRLDAPQVKRARLTLEDFWKIYAAAGELDPWVQNALALALVSLQRREDVALMGFRSVDIVRLAVRQTKTGVRLRIPLELRLKAVGWSLGDVVARCRDAVLSARLLHHTRHQGRARPGMAVHPQTLTTSFAEARARAGIVTEAGRSPPTFHELRSLGARLYLQQGYDPQALLGHKDASTTAVYLDDRGAQWIDVAA